MFNSDKQISASILSADFSCLGEDVKKVLAAGADAIHVDVMDNHYVPNLTFGPLVCEALRNAQIKAPLDVHLMARPVDNLIVDFAKAGATAITFHPEASDHVDRSLQLIRELGCKAGLALNPATPLGVLQHVLDKIDLVLIMSVNPGFGGQKFIPEALNKVSEARELIDTLGLPIKISIDGGVKEDNICEIAKAGADIFVIGSALFKSKDYQATIASFKKQWEKIVC